jgi:hypothetical protein
MFINTGLLARLENEAQLAQVLAHEVVHTLERHQLKFVRLVPWKGDFFKKSLGHLAWTCCVRSPNRRMVSRMSSLQDMYFPSRGLGPAVNRSADHADVDGLVFAKMAGFKKSGGEIAKDVTMTIMIAVATLGSVVAIQPSKGASLQVALVDGATGDILWANTAGTTGDFEGSGLEQMVKTLFEGFPGRD